MEGPSPNCPAPAIPLPAVPAVLDAARRPKPLVFFRTGCFWYHVMIREVSFLEAPSPSHSSPSFPVPAGLDAAPPPKPLFFRRAGRFWYHIMIREVSLFDKKGRSEGGQTQINKKNEDGRIGFKKSCELLDNGAYVDAGWKACARAWARVHLVLPRTIFERTDGKFWDRRTDRWKIFGWTHGRQLHVLIDLNFTSRSASISPPDRPQVHVQIGLNSTSRSASISSTNFQSISQSQVVTQQL